MSTDTWGGQKWVLIGSVELELQWPWAAEAQESDHSPLREQCTLFMAEGSLQLLFFSDAAFIFITYK